MASIKGLLANDPKLKGKASNNSELGATGVITRLRGISCLAIRVDLRLCNAATGLGIRGGTGARPRRGRSRLISVNASGDWQYICFVSCALLEPQFRLS